MLKFKATPQALIDIALKAINASEPMGMGFLHYEQKQYTITDIMDGGVDVLHPDGCFIDYFAGRMVKLRIYKIDDELSKIGEGVYEVDNFLHPEYQSFCKVYKDMKSLLESVKDVEIIQ